MLYCCCFVFVFVGVVFFVSVMFLFVYFCNVLVSIIIGLMSLMELKLFIKVIGDVFKSVVDNMFV